MPDLHESGVGDVANVSDADLVLRSRSGDTRAFGELWARHYRSGIVAANSITSSIDADDLVQEAYAKIFQTVRRGGGPTSSFRAYLFTTIRNTSATWGRSREDLAIDEIEQFQDPNSTDQAAEAALDRGVTHTAFRGLPTRWQEVLWYTEIEQLKPREIAPLLGMKASAVSQLAVRAREGLREAWIQAHLATVDDGSDHQWVIERLGAHTRGNLGSRDRKKLAAHLAGCARCAIVADEAEEVGGRIALILLPLAIGIPAASAYIGALEHGQHTVVALAAMPPAVVEGGTVVGGAVLAGGASNGSGGGSAGSASTTGTAWTVGGIVTATVATAVVAAVVIAGAASTGLSTPSAASNDFASSAPGSASIEASDDLAATQTPDDQSADENTDDQVPDADDAMLGISGASVVNARAGTIAIDLEGAPDRSVGVHAPGTTAPFGAGGIGLRRATASVRVVAGPELGATTIGSDGRASITIALTPDQVRADVTISIQYPNSAAPPASASLSGLGVLEPLLAALEEPSEPAPKPDPTPDPTPSEEPTPSGAPEPAAPAPVPWPEPSTTPSAPPSPAPTETPSPTPTATPTTPAQPSPTPSAPAQPSPTPTATPSPTPTPTPTPVKPATPTEMPSAPAKPSPAPTETPSAPDFVKAERVGDEVHVAWSEVDDASSYKVYVDSDETFEGAKPVGSSKVGFLTISPPTDYGTYYYFVTSVNSNGESGASVSNDVEVSDTAEPTAPTEVAVTDDGRLSWSESDDDVGIDHYVVARNGKKLATAKTTSFVDGDSLQTGVYEYVIVAVDAAGNKSPASQAAKRTVRPDAPSGLRINRDGPLLQWNASDIVDPEYIVYLDGAELARTKDLSYDAVVMPGPHEFAVSLHDANGVESVRSAPVAYIEPPRAPNVTVSDEGVVSWDAAEFGSDNAVTYMIYRSMDSDEPRVRLTETPISETSYRDTKPVYVPGRYYYFVKAVVGDVTSEFSAPISRDIWFPVVGTRPPA